MLTMLYDHIVNKLLDLKEGFIFIPPDFSMPQGISPEVRRGSSSSGLCPAWGASAS